MPNFARQVSLPRELELELWRSRGCETFCVAQDHLGQSFSQNWTNALYQGETRVQDDVLTRSQGISPPKPHLSNALPEIYPEPHDIPQGWGLTFFLHLKDSAVHSEGTGWWAGLPNLFWWADRKRVRTRSTCLLSSSVRNPSFSCFLAGKQEGGTVGYWQDIG